MGSKVKRIALFLGGGIAGLGLAVALYAGWQTYQDFQALKQIKAKYGAIKTYRNVTQQRPTDPQAHLSLGNAWMDFYEDSGKGIRLASQLDPYEMMSDWTMAAPGALEAAIAAYSKALQLDSTLPEAYTGLCRAQVAQNKSTEAQKTLATCRKAAEFQPQRAQTHLSLGLALWYQKNHGAAVASFRKAVALEPNNGNAYYQLGRALVSNNQPQEAEVQLRKAIQLSPQGNMTYISLGDALVDQGKPEAAIAAYRQSLRVSVDQPLAYAALGQVLLQQGRVDEAIANYQELIRRYPPISEGYRGLGSALGQKNRLTEALAAYDQAAREDPKDPYILRERGVLYARTGERAKAMTDLQNAAKFAPKDADTLNILCWNGSLLGQAAQIMEACNQAVAVADPQSKPNAQDSRGVARALTGNKPGAIADFQAFVQWFEAEGKTAVIQDKNLAEKHAKRQEWIAELQQGRNPFTPALQKALLAE